MTTTPSPERPGADDERLAKKLADIARVLGAETAGEWPRSGGYEYKCTLLEAVYARDTALAAAVRERDEARAELTRLRSPPSADMEKRSRAALEPWDGETASLADYVKQVAAFASTVAREAREAAIEEAAASHAALPGDPTQRASKADAIRALSLTAPQDRWRPIDDEARNIDDDVILGRTSDTFRILAHYDPHPDHKGYPWVAPGGCRYPERGFNRWCRVPSPPTQGHQAVSGLPSMTPSAEERARAALGYQSELDLTSEPDGPVRDAIVASFRDGALAERERIVTWLREPAEEDAEDIAELFDEFFLPAAQACTKKHGRPMHPAFASWGLQFLRALSDRIAAEGKDDK